MKYLLKTTYGSIMTIIQPQNCITFSSIMMVETAW